MKLYKNGCMYLEKDDPLFVGILPKEVVDEMLDDPTSETSLIVFRSRTAINFWRKRKDILDYNAVKKLTDKDIRIKIIKLVREIVDLNVKRGESGKDKQVEITNKIKSLEYMKSTYEKYLSNRMSYDSKFSYLN